MLLRRVEIGVVQWMFLSPLFSTQPSLLGCFAATRSTGGSYWSRPWFRLDETFGSPPPMDATPMGHQPSHPKGYATPPPHWCATPTHWQSTPIMYHPPHCIVHGDGGHWAKSLVYVFSRWICQRKCVKGFFFFHFCLCVFFLCLFPTLVSISF